MGRRGDSGLLVAGVLIFLLLIWPLAAGAGKSHGQETPDAKKGGGAHLYWISPRGKDSNPGTSKAKPWKTFRHAIASLKPGETLLLEDGTYDSSDSGYPDINCISGAADGAPAAVITIKAENERQAFIRGDGTAYPLAIQNCSYWKVEGLHVENGDFDNRHYQGTANTEAKFGDTIFLYRDSHLLLQRNILARANRYSNSHLIDNYFTTHSSFVENEFYYFHRHAILDMHGGWNTYIRNYANSRMYIDLPNGRASHFADRGDVAISLYPAHDALLENNISENNELLSDIQCAYSQYECDNNRFFGNISLHDYYGHVLKARGTGDGAMPHHVLVENEVVIDPLRTAIYFRAVKDAHCNHCTVLGDGSKGVSGLVADHGGFREDGDGTFSVYIANSLAVGFSGSGASGFTVVDDKQASWELNHVNAYGNRTNFDPKLPNPRIHTATTLDPHLGGCMVWIPSGSALKGMGTNHSDIGANVLYRYEDGKLTSEPLWDRTSGEFPHGATVRGLNDLPGQSAFDVNQRLAVNSGGCKFPPGY